MPIRWDEFPHNEMRLKIYARLSHNGIGRSAEDSLRHILWRRLVSLDRKDHRRFIELEAHDIIEHLRSTRDVYQEFVEKHNCRPLLEAHWVVLRFAVFPTAIGVLRARVVNYLKLSRILAQDLSLLFGIPTHTGSGTSNSIEILRDGLVPYSPLDFSDDTPATDDELVALGNLINKDSLLWFRDIREGGGVGRPFGGGPFAIDDRRSIRRSWALCALSMQMTLVEWMKIREELWHERSPWTNGLVTLFGCVQEELLSQWEAIPPDSMAHEFTLKEHNSNLKEVVVPAETPLPLRLQRGKDCEELAKEITTIKHKRVYAGLTITEIQAETSFFKIWKRVDVLSPEDKDTFLHPSTWEPGYANLLLGKLYADSRRNVAPGTVNTWRKEYRKYLRWQTINPLRTPDDFGKELQRLKQSYRKPLHTS